MPDHTGTQLCVPITSEADVVVARQKARALGAALNFAPNDLVLIASAISELGANLINYSRRGDISMEAIGRNGRTGLSLVARGYGPASGEAHRTILDGYSISGGIGLGLPGVRRVMDEFEITNEPDGGTAVRVAKWRR